MRPSALNFKKSILLWSLVFGLGLRSGFSEEPLITQTQFQGPLPGSATDLVHSINALAGEPIDPVRVQALADSLAAAWLQIGYPKATVTWNAVGDEKGEGLRLTFTSSPGPAAVWHLGDLSLKGNTVTQPHILLRELPVYSGMRLTSDDLARVQNNLLGTSLFSDVTLTQFETASPGVVDLEVKVSEARTGRIETGASYTEDTGPLFLFQLQERNFAWGPPWRGQALQVSLGAQLGSDLTQVDARLRNPRMGVGLWRLDTTIFYEDNGTLSDFYAQESLGAQLFFSHPYGPNNLLSIGVGYTRYEVYDVDERLADDPTLNDESDVDLSAIYGIWSFENLDRRFRPTRGFRMKQQVGMGTDLLGGNTEVFEYENKAHLYLNPLKDHVILFKGGINSVDPLGGTQDVPIPLREWLGGVENLRGFSYHSISPFTEEGVPIGGLSSWWGAVEYMVPLHPFLDASVYYEVGHVSADAWDLGTENMVSDWGAGLLVRAENFPVRLDLAFPITVAEGDLINKKGEAFFSFSVGYTF